MRKPKNFRKIDGIAFTLRTGNKYMFQTDGISPELWVFREPDDTPHVLAFIMNWENETYEIKRAGNGKGTNWVETIHKGVYTIEPMRKMNTFIDWVQHRVAEFETFYN